MEKAPGPSQEIPNANDINDRGIVRENLAYLESKEKINEKRRLRKKKTKLKDVSSLKQDIFIDDHLIPLPEFYARYDTDPDKGLTKEEAQLRLERDGLNELTPPKTTSQFWIFMNHMFYGFSLILWICAGLCFISYIVSKEVLEEDDQSVLYLATIIVVVVVVSGVFAYFQDRSTSKIMDSFKKMITQSATVIRDGKAISIPSEYLVKGDVVLIKFGNKIPADIRIIENFGVKVDNSSLTGETEPQPRSVEATNKNPLETQNLAFYSTSVMEGTCKGVVFEVGDKTFIGRLASLTVGLKRGDSPMTIEIKHFNKLITVVSTAMATIFVVIALCLGNSIINCVTYFIALMVANIPEGLLVTVTLSLTLTAKRMAKKNCLIKCMDSVETLGSTSTICSDKTGTLTQNRMTVADIVYNFKTYAVKYAPNRSSTISDEFNVNDRDFQNLMRCARLCLRAEFEDSGPPSEAKPVLDRVVEGDASEAAILKFAECVFPDVNIYRRENPKVMEIPFNSTNKYQLSIHRCSGKNVLFMKGAPEKILELCSTVSISGANASLTQGGKQQIEQLLVELGSRGERVLGFCDVELPGPLEQEFDVAKKNYPTSNLRFLGLIALIDPPREAVPEAVSKCRTAGIRVIMVTGDHPVTAEAIARKVGIITNETRIDVAKRLQISPEMVPQNEVKAIVVTGDELRRMTNDELDAILMNHDDIVFARTTPTQKLSIVEGCQRLGFITAVTGDGVNDSPALKKADIGVAMGIAGSDVSKQAADMILLDDNFASIVTGVEEGRIIFDNLKKSIAYVLTSNIPEMTPFIAYIIFSLPMPLSVVAILIVDVGTDMLPAISLAYEKAESDIMLRQPRNPFQDKLVNRRLIWMAYGQIGIIQTMAAFAGYFLVMGQHGFYPMDLLGIRYRWENKAIIVTDSYGQDWGYHQRKFLEHYCQSCFFAAIVVTQLADVIICKTRRNSIFRQGMTNWMLNAGMIFAVALGCLLLYTPGLYQYLLLPPIRFEHWLPGVPFALLIIIYDETRRAIIRSRPLEKRRTKTQEQVLSILDRIRRKAFKSRSDLNDSWRQKAETASFIKKTNTEKPLL